MKFKFPLYLKILSWFFVNLIIVACIFLVLIKFNLKAGIDALFVDHALKELGTIASIMAPELARTPMREWNTILDRYSHMLNTPMMAIRSDGSYIAGEKADVPQEVKARLVQPRPPIARGFGLGRGFGQGFGLGQGFGFRRGALQSPAVSSSGQTNINPALKQQFDGWQFSWRSDSPRKYWLVSALPSINVPPAQQQVFLVAMPSSIQSTALGIDITPWIWAAIGVLSISALLWTPLVRHVTRSIASITRATERIAEGDFKVRVPENRSDELGQLATAINKMAEHLEGFVQNQKRFMGDIAHELCSPIARIQMALGVLEQRADKNNIKFIEDLREEIQQMSELVNELLLFSKATVTNTPPKVYPVVIRDIIEKAVNREAQNVDISIEVPNDLTVLAVPDLLLRAISNVLRNSVRYASNYGQIKIIALRDNDKVHIKVQDSGKGVPQEFLDKIFEPFYRLDPARNRETGGFGLGLAIVKTAIQACGGEVNARNLMPSGFEVDIILKSA